MAEKSDDSSSANNNKHADSLHYIRPADRTPEKNFHKLDKEDKKLICGRRALTERVRTKISRLEDELDERFVFTLRKESPLCILKSSMWQQKTMCSELD